MSKNSLINEKKVFDSRHGIYKTEAKTREHLYKILENTKILQHQILSLQHRQAKRNVRIYTSV